MFGIGRGWKRGNAVVIGEEMVKLALISFWDNEARAYDTRVWEKPYLLGLLKSLILTRTLPPLGKNWREDDRDNVAQWVLKNIGAPQAVLERMNKLGLAQEREYMRGIDDGWWFIMLWEGAFTSEEHSSTDVEIACIHLQTMREESPEEVLKLPKDPKRALAALFLKRKMFEYQEHFYPNFLED